MVPRCNKRSSWDPGGCYRLCDPGPHQRLATHPNLVNEHEEVQLRIQPSSRSPGSFRLILRLGRRTATFERAPERGRHPMAQSSLHRPTVSDQPRRNRGSPDLPSPSPGPAASRHSLSCSQQVTVHAGMHRVVGRRIESLSPSNKRDERPPEFSRLDLKALVERPSE
jgi:hypothetical protein